MDEKLTLEDRETHLYLRQWFFSPYLKDVFRLIDKPAFGKVCCFWP
jgi:hypothetical protein